jgi:hypothetical protein
VLLEEIQPSSSSQFVSQLQSLAKAGKPKGKVKIARNLIFVAIEAGKIHFKKHSDTQKNAIQRVSF